VLQHLHILAFTHRNLEVNKIGLMHIEKDLQSERLHKVKESNGISELFFLSTCNRVELTFVKNQEIDELFVKSLLQTTFPNLSDDVISDLADKVETYSGTNAVEHALAVASSIDSMIVGEREIITQVRLAYEHCRDLKLTGDLIRILMKQVIQTAKKVYTETSIATKPVSVVSLAYHQLKKLNIALDARILVIGAGMTNTTMSRFLKKHGFTNFAVFNRSLEKANEFATEIKGEAFSLSELKYYDKGFDVILTCTGADFHIITPELYDTILQGEKRNKIIIDLAIPQDLDPVILENNDITYISVDFLQKISNQNLKERSKEIQHVEKILATSIIEFENLLKERNVELAMKTVPQSIKEIKNIAFSEVFKNDLDSMDEHSKEVLEKIIGYMEKKYISGPMKLAKEILLKNV
jgi:glutamyl-tRNA reductase